MFRRDRQHGFGGGILIFAKHSLSIKRRVDLESPEIENLVVEIQNSNKKFILCSRLNLETSELIAASSCWVTL
mgnify:CR=1 FL=1